MKPCVVGIGGAGGNVLKMFLQSQDVDLVVYKFGVHQAFGDVKGIWLDSASQDADPSKQNFYGCLTDGKYPGYLISHDIIDANSPTRSYVKDLYGFDLKAQGYDRRAEYLKGIFEIFDFDTNLKNLASKEFGGEKNPLPSYIWKRGIRPFTLLNKSLANGDRNGNGNSSGTAKKEKSQDAASLGQNLINAIGNLTDQVVNDRAPAGTKTNLCDSILFIASLGGGTGTGFINPITSYVRSEELAFPIFAIGILTERGPESREATEGQRDLGAVIALSDLLTRRAGTGIDGLIIVDNQILVNKHKKNWPAMDEEIYNAMKPLLDSRDYPGVAQGQSDTPAMRRVFWEADKTNGTPGEESTILLPPFMVPCYHSRKAAGKSVETLVESALSSEGRLFPCDPRKADRAYVFASGFFDALGVDEAVQKRTGLPDEKVKVYRKIGDGRHEEVLILLRDPYGGTPGAHEIEDTFEWRMHGIVSEAITYADENPTNIIEYLGYKDLTKEHLRRYLYGENGLGSELQKCLTRLESGEKPVFTRQLKIFGDGMEAPVADATPKSHGGVQMTEAEIRGMVREEVAAILREGK
jgi:cell division GTPase FtsZ